MEERDSQKGFGGLLHGLDIRNLIQICAVNGITGRVQIETDDERGEIYFEKGEIVHSACGDLQGVESLRRIIGWEGGEIRLEPGVPPPAVTVDVPWQALLLTPAINPQETEVKKEEEEEGTPPPAKSQASETLWSTGSIRRSSPGRRSATASSTPWRSGRWSVRAPLCPGCTGGQRPFKNFTIAATPSAPSGDTAFLC